MGDVDGDQKEDFFVGGSAGFSGILYRQVGNDRFEMIKEGPWNVDAASEDSGVVFFDADNDGDMDLFVVSGGNEFAPGSPNLQDRLYVNNGNGSFTKAKNVLPEYFTSGSCVIPFDYDRDGDMDLFVGGRLIPGKYPLSASSHLLENSEGVFVDVSEQRAPGFKDLGMVTAACWADLDQNGESDLIIVGEWMPVSVFHQQNGNFSRASDNGLEDSGGWYYSIAAEDMDDDGDIDLVAGNLGLNYKYKASPEEPFQVYSGDFDDNGRLDIVLSYYEHGDVFSGPWKGLFFSANTRPQEKISNL